MQPTSALSEADTNSDYVQYQRPQQNSESASHYWANPKYLLLAIVQKLRLLHVIWYHMGWRSGNGTLGVSNCFSPCFQPALKLHLLWMLRSWYFPAARLFQFKSHIPYRI